MFIQNSAPYLLITPQDETNEALILGYLSSTILDWYARRFIEVNVNFFLINAFPLPRPPTTHRRCVTEFPVASQL